jgi:hypothetical protein
VFFALSVVCGRADGCNRVDRTTNPQRPCLAAAFFVAEDTLPSGVTPMRIEAGVDVEFCIELTQFSETV